MMVSLATSTALAFNLTCAGSLETTDFFGKKAEPYSYTYRIDLDAAKYCEAQCKAIKPIYEIQPAFITLEKPEDINTVTEKRFFQSSINRETGHQSTLITSGRGSQILIMKWDGQCEKSDFTGFPKPLTKF